MNVINELKTLASPDDGSLIQQDQKASCQSDETFSVNMVWEGEH